MNPQELAAAGFTIRPTLGNACAALAAACDGAHARDGHGFNAYDAAFGRAMAELGEANWTPRQKRAVWKLLRKYKAQLLANGIVYSQIPEPPDPQVIPIAAAPSYSPVKEVRYDPAEDRFELVSPFDPVAVADVRRIPGRRWDGQRKLNLVRAALEAVDALQAFAEKHGLEWTAAALERLSVFERERQGKRELFELSTALDYPLEPIAGLGGELMPFQRAGVRYAQIARRTFIADEQGLGKTMQALAFLQLEQAFPAVVLCPASVKLQWAAKARQWLPGRTVRVLEGRSTGGELFDPYAAADLLVLNWDIVYAHAEAIASRVKLRAIVADEIHNIGNPKTLRTRYALALASGVLEPKKKGEGEVARTIGEPVELRLGLSGTVLVNRVADLATQLEFLGRIDDFGGRSEFKGRYAYVAKAEGNKRLLELNALLRERCYVRRLKADAMPQLPAKVREPFSVEIDNRDEYDRAEADVARWCGEQAAADRAFLLEIAGLPADEQEQRKRERAMSAEMRARAAEQLVRFNALKKLAARGKLAQAKAWIRDFVAAEKLVVFAWHQEIVTAIASTFDNAPLIYGDVSLKDRVAAVERFNRDESARILVANIKSGGTGVDGLQGAASNSLFLELAWNPATHDQAEDRLHRIGQADSVTAWYMLASGTIDEELVELIESKRAISAATLDGREVTANVSILNALADRLVAKYGLAGES